MSQPSVAYRKARQVFRSRVLLAMDDAAREATGDPRALGATYEDLPKLLPAIDRAFANVIMRDNERLRELAK